MKKVNVGIIGTGNIGTDLLFKVNRSNILQCSIFTGRNIESEGIKRAKKIGIRTSIDSIKAIEKEPRICDIVFDATSAEVHITNAPILNKLGIYTIDLTPANIGKMCVPVINLEQCLEEKNVNMITCGGQATIPIIYAISKIQQDIKYVEIVANISSKSAGLGTRNNIDEFTQTTKDAIYELTGLLNAKAIITLNPAKPPVFMHNTIYMIIENPNMNNIRNQVFDIVEKVKKYVPGYNLTLEPTLENGRVTIMVEVTGAGDFLPKYSGNLDIITCAALNLAEQYALKKVLKEDKYIEITNDI